MASSRFLLLRRFSSFLLPMFLLRCSHPSIAAPMNTEFVYPNFTASNLLYVDHNGVFLQSPAAIFQAVLASLSRQQPDSFYFSVVHAPTRTIIWTANRGGPVSNAAVLVLSTAGLALSTSDGSTVWSTPPLGGAVFSLRLNDTGNLQLLGRSNATLWQSFDHPTDTFISGQTLAVGNQVVSAVSDYNLTEGDYHLDVTNGDVLLRWGKGSGQQYWSLSTDAKAVKDSNGVASHLGMNATGLYVYDRAQVLWELPALPPAALRIAKLDAMGRFTITSYSQPNSSTYIDQFIAPRSDCDLPFSCLTLGLCSSGQSNYSCSCSPGFGSWVGGCEPSDGFSLPSASVCPDAVSFVSIGDRISYFASKFMTPAASGGDFEGCRSLCSSNCSCVGFYYRNSSGFCFLLENRLGSFSGKYINDDHGYIKVVQNPLRRSGSSGTDLVAIVLPIVSVVLLILLVVAIFWWRRRRRGLKKATRFSGKGRRMSWPSTRSNDEEDEDEEEICIPGLPTRFSYEELVAATDGFRTRIGVGGFGEVYKGVLPDQKMTVAVKRITNLGIQGKREFCTEIAVIGNIHHVNLVKLRGFCVQGKRRLLVYEFMSRGSLERSLFAAAGSPVLEWGERAEIALGAARGLAYLHGGCDNKIIHCDVKPENILLGDYSQVKISDFGLSKLLAPEQSALFTTMRGTRGYLAPEWLTSSAISDRTDVYSYGMVLLEIVRGHKNSVVVGPTEGSSDMAAGSEGSSSGTSSIVKQKAYFPMYALEMHEQGNYLELADPRLGGRVEATEVEKFVRIALCCLHEEPPLRPSMATVVGMLEGSVPLWMPRTESLNFLRFYGRGFQARPDATTVIAAAMGAGAVGLGHGGFYGRGHHIGSTSTGSTTSTSLSHMSAHQLSGPR